MPRLRNRTVLAVASSLVVISLLSVHWSGVYYFDLPNNDYSTNSRRKFSDDFLSDWCSARERVNWKLLLQPCERFLRWSDKNWNKTYRTSAKHSYITSWDIRPAGQFSRFILQSRSADQVNKLEGGDSWRVHIQGTAWISPSVIDRNDGKYEVLFLAMEPGNYTAHVVLDYSLCDGYRDPPHDWFIQGNSQGKHQPEGLLGELDDYLLQSLQNSQDIVFTIPTQSPTNIVTEQDLRELHLRNHCGTSCRFLWDGHGRWLNRKWKPFVPGSLIEPHFRDLSLGKGTLWAYGDSLNFNNYRYNFVPSRLCKQMFEQCRYNINFVYHIKYRKELDTTETDNLDFNQTRVLRHFQSVLLDPDVNHVNSVIFLNFGLHYVMGLSFERYQRLIFEVIKVIKETKSSGAPKFKGHVIWKTTTAVHKERAKDPQATKWRFCTYPRVQLFNTFATSAMCRAGIEVVDMFPITDSYPDGTYDVVHYRPPASQPLVPLLVNHLLTG